MYPYYFMANSYQAAGSTESNFPLSGVDEIIRDWPLRRTIAVFFSHLSFLIYALENLSNPISWKIP